MTTLEQALADYLQLRRSLGHEMAEAAWLLPGLVAYLDGQGIPTVTIQAVLQWAQQSETTVGPRRMTAARGFARYLTGIDASTEVPPLGLMPRRPIWRRPFIYTSTDIDALMSQARGSILQPLRAATYHTLIGLLAASGFFSRAQALRQGLVSCVCAAQKLTWKTLSSATGVVQGDSPWFTCCGE